MTKIKQLFITIFLAFSIIKELDAFLYVFGKMFESSSKTIVLNYLVSDVAITFLFIKTCNCFMNTLNKSKKKSSLYEYFNSTLKSPYMRDTLKKGCGADLSGYESTMESRLRAIRTERAARKDDRSA